MDAQEIRTFEAFVASSGARLFGTALVLSAGDRGHAEDLLQQALAKVARQWGRIEHDPEGYTRRALTRLATDRWRRHRVRVAEVGGVEHDVADPRCDDQLTRVELREALWDVLSELSPRQRAVLALRYLEDLTEAQTAEVLGVAVGTVKSAHSRALARLRELMPTDPNAEVHR